MGETMKEKHYRVSYGRIKMPAGTTGKYYLRRECQDGAVTFLPVPEAISQPEPMPANQ